MKLVFSVNAATQSTRLRLLMALRAVVEITGPNVYTWKQGVTEELNVLDERLSRAISFLTREGLTNRERFIWSVGSSQACLRRLKGLVSLDSGDPVSQMVSRVEGCLEEVLASLPSLVEAEVRPRPGHQDPFVFLPELSDRERQVLKLTAQGFRADQVAKRLQVKVSTVRTHLDNLREKLKARTLAHAAAIYVAAESQDFTEETAEAANQ